MSALCKFNIEDFSSIEDGKVRHGVLVLKNESYPRESFKGRDNILFVYAENLKSVSY